VGFDVVGFATTSFCAADAQLASTGNQYQEDKNAIMPPQKQFN
jgi:hypothetical protein